jgi:hypothetical protein
VRTAYEQRAVRPINDAARAAQLARSGGQSDDLAGVEAKPLDARGLFICDQQLNGEAWRSQEQKRCSEKSRFPHRRTHQIILPEMFEPAS